MMSLTIYYDVHIHKVSVSSPLPLPLPRPCPRPFFSPLLPSHFESGTVLPRLGMQIE